MQSSSEPHEDQTARQFPAHGRLLGLDFGTHRVGLAISNPEQTIASPLQVFVRSTPAAEARILRQLVEEHRIAGLVVGLPVHMSGDEGDKATAAREYGNWAAGTIALPVRFFDERYTSAIAEQYLREANLSRKQRKERLDKLAAQIMLQSFLEGDRGEQAPAALHG